MAGKTLERRGDQVYLFVFMCLCVSLCVCVYVCGSSREEFKNEVNECTCLFNISYLQIANENVFHCKCSYFYTDTES